MSPRAIKRHVSKVLNFGEVKANTIGRPIKSVAMHPNVEFLLWNKCLNTPKRHHRTFKSNDDGNVHFKFSYISLRPLQNNKVK